MRRIYESSALDSDDSTPFKPNEAKRSFEPQAMRSINATLLSRLLVPRWVRRRALSVSVSTPRSAFDAGEVIPFAVTIKNAMPFPVSVRTNSPLLWTWTVDGLVEAAEVPQHQAPDEPKQYRFSRGERLRFTKRWDQRIRQANGEWEAVPPGEHTIGASLNVDGAVGARLSDETTVSIRA